MSSDDADVLAVEEANRALYAAVENADLDAMSSLWADGADAGCAVCVHPGWPPVVGRAHVIRSWALVMAGTQYIQFFLTDVRTCVFGDIAVLSCAENILTAVGGPASDGLAGGRVVTTNVFRRTDGGWRALVHHASPLLPAGEPGGAGEEGSDADLADGGPAPGKDEDGPE